MFCNDNGSGPPARLLWYMLSENNIKSELSYAYLHAVSARAGFACSVMNRHLDNAAVDAQVDIRERLAPESIFTTFHLHFQLKSTSSEPSIVDECCSFPLEIPQYEKLRDIEVCVPRFLVLFELPPTAEEWLNVSPEQVVARKCGRWVSLRGAPATENSDSIAVYVPVSQVLTPASLREIATRVSIGEELKYAE